MKISEFIAQMQAIQAEHGDIEVKDVWGEDVQAWYAEGRMKSWFDSHGDEHEEYVYEPHVQVGN
jgi:hypothetical protein